MEQVNSFLRGSEESLPDMTANGIRIEAVLGRGGMGTVYRATHLNLDREVAVKIINTDVAANQDISQRFTREARLMAKLRHPRAAMIYDSGKLSDDRLFIVMEYVEGDTLADVLRREKKINYRRAIEIAVSVCEVLSEAHSLGIIHRDLKPANIMLNYRGIFVLDFGIAKMLHSDNPESLSLSMTGTGMLVGTPYYMSPEQCLGEKVGAQSDLYSLGAVIYEMIAGRPPFNDQVLSAIIIRHVTSEPKPLEEFSPDVPPALSELVKRLLAKKPEERPSSADEVRSLLQASIGKSGNTTNFDNYKTQHLEPSEPISSQAEKTQPLAAVDLTSSTPAPMVAIPSSAKTTAAAHLTSSVLGEQLSEPPRKRSFLTFGLPLAAILLATLGVGGFYLFKSQPTKSENVIVANNQPQNTLPANNSYSSGPGDQMNHDMGNMAMGPDFAEKVEPAGSDKNITATTIPLISDEEADKVITHITQTTEHRADGMQIIKTPKDSAIVCIHNMIEMGKTHVFAVERPNINSPWEISARVSLDTDDFHGAAWTFEPQDVDGDGFEEVIFKGVSADNKSHKFLIYCPRTRQNYWVTAKVTANGKFFKSGVFAKCPDPWLKGFPDRA